MTVCTARPRRTLARPTDIFEGVGLHSGRTASLRISPAASGSGLSFIDLSTGIRIAAKASSVADAVRCTRLQEEGVSIQTVEHVLSALAGLGVDDAEIEVGGGEVPAADGSAAPFVGLLLRAGIREQDGESVVVAKQLAGPEFVTGENGAVVVAVPSASFRASVILEYPQHSYIGVQACVFDGDTGDYEIDIAPARTFGFLAEVEALRARGLAGGASYDNALVLGMTGYENAPRFPDELARHKLLDLIGDLALIGRPLGAHVIAVRPSHALNTRLAFLCS